MESIPTQGEVKKIPRIEQISKTHHEMFKMLEVYLEDCLRIVKSKRVDPGFIDTVNRIKEFYTSIQNSKEKQ